MSETFNKIFQKYFTKQSIMVALIFIFYFLSRLFLLWRYGDTAFGYDTGIYRHYIDGYWEKFGDPSLQPMAFSWFSNFFKFIGFPTDMIMFEVYFLLAGLMFWLIYWVVKKYFDRSSAVWSVFLFSVSLVQFEFYQWYYYRSFLAVLLLLLSLLLFHYRSYFVILPLVLAFCLHPLSALPVLLAMVVMFFVNKNSRKYWLVVGGATAILGLVLNWSEFFGQYLYIKENNWQANLNQSSSSESTGQFVSGWFVVRSILFYLFFGLLGVWKYYRKQKLLLSVLIFSLLGIIGQIIFYRRLFIWVDIILIMFAGAFLADLFISLGKQRLFKSLVLIFCLGVTIFVSCYIYLKPSLIKPEELLSIKSANSFLDSDYILSLSSTYAPWLYGYTDKKVIAPGMFENNLMNYEEWLIIWISGDEEKINEMFARYQEPIYIFVGETDKFQMELLSKNKNFHEINKYWWRFSI